MMILEKIFFRGGRFYSVEGSGGYLVFRLPQHIYALVEGGGDYYCIATIQYWGLLLCWHNIYVFVEGVGNYSAATIFTL